MPRLPGGSAPHPGDHVGHVAAEVAVVHAARRQRLPDHDGLLRAVLLHEGARHRGRHGQGARVVRHLCDRHRQHAGANRVRRPQLDKGHRRQRPQQRHHHAGRHFHHFQRPLRLVNALSVHVRGCVRHNHR